MPVPPPDLPEDRLREQGWERIEDTEDTLASLPLVTVRGRTLVYGDRALRDRVIDAADPPLDQPWRFFFATRLALSPSPPGPSLVAGIVRSRGREGFADRLRDRGYTALEQGRSEDVRVGSGERATMACYRGTDSVDVGDRSVSIPVEGWVGVWHHEGSFRVAGGAYPATNLGSALGVDVETDPSTFRSELFGLVREVE